MVRPTWPPSRLMLDGLATSAPYRSSYADDSSSMVIGCSAARCISSLTRATAAAEITPSIGLPETLMSLLPAATPCLAACEPAVTWLMMTNPPASLNVTPREPGPKVNVRRRFWRSASDEGTGEATGGTGLASGGIGEASGGTGEASGGTGEATGGARLATGGSAGAVAGVAGVASLLLLNGAAMAEVRPLRDDPRFSAGFSAFKVATWLAAALTASAQSASSSLSWPSSIDASRSASAGMAACSGVAGATVGAGPASGGAGHHVHLQRVWEELRNNFDFNNDGKVEPSEFLAYFVLNALYRTQVGSVVVRVIAYMSLMGIEFA